MTSLEEHIHEEMFILIIRRFICATAILMIYISIAPLECPNGFGKTLISFTLFESNY